MGPNRLTSAPARFDQTLRPHPSSVGAARRLVRELVTAAGRTDLVDDAVLLVSEIVTNALIHAGSPMRVRGRLGGRGIRVEVSDASPHQPALRDYADTAGTGRGLGLLVELVDDWGVAPDEVGKTVWFELGGVRRREHRDRDPLDHPGAGAPRHGARGTAPAEKRTGRGATVPVQLLKMPLLLHEAWREHAETLLREYLLASLDRAAAGPAVNTSGIAADETGAAWEDPIQVHADATDAMALLEEQVPVANVDMEPARLMAEATEPGVTAQRVLVQIPQTSVPHFATLERALEQAFVLVDSGQVLARRTQPEIQAFRRWLCRQVEGQSVGEPPVPWSIDHLSDQPPSTRTTRFALEGIMSSAESLIASDDANQIVAVSPSAAVLLGYDSGAELVGQRLVAIIPPRLHQAHIAGFTLHLLVGRSPLIGREVQVPALRRDGTEVPVRLEVRPRSAPDGATLFVAGIRPVADADQGARSAG